MKKLLFFYLIILSLVSLSCVAQMGAAGNNPVVVPDGGIETIAGRIVDRNFPSIFAPWNFGADKQTNPGDPAARETRLTNIARHDLYWNEWSSLGLKAGGDQPYVILSPQFTPESIQAALRMRAALLAMNPNLIILVNVHYFSVNGRGTWLPPGSPYFISGPKADEYNSRKLDFYHSEYQDLVAALCAALIKSGVFDGIMFDLWNSEKGDQQQYAQANAARLQLIRKVRAAIGDKAIIIGNCTNGFPTPEVASYMNGMYMEGFGSNFFPDWRTAAGNIHWAQSHFCQPVITALEGWYSCGSCQGDIAGIQQGRADFARMRYVTALALVFSNGYTVFSDPNNLPTPDHLHDWYPFWSKSLGKALGPLATLDRPDLSGAYTRQFQKGEAVFNPSKRAVVVTFPETRRSASTNATGTSFTVAAGDGDLFLDMDAMPHNN